MFLETGKKIRIIKNILTVTIFLLPFGIHLSMAPEIFLLYTSLVYFLFFIVIFYEVMRFLTRPSYINMDIIVAAACGYLLLIETSSFLFQFFYYRSSDVFNGISSGKPFSIFMDLVYFSSITLTSIGFGDITAKAYFAKLTVALLGIIGQFYAVVLMGILVSKFTSKETKEDDKFLKSSFIKRE